MRILQIQIENERAIKVFNIRLNGENLEVAGDVGEGKTTAINALWDILEKRGDSLRHGEKKGLVRVKLGAGDKKIIATRKMTNKTSTISLIDEDGDSVSMSDFKKMLSALSVNPHKIIELRGKERVAVLLTAADMGDFDLEAVDEEIAAAEHERLFSKRAVDRSDPGEDAPTEVERVDVGELIIERDKKTGQNERVQRAKNSIAILIGQRADAEKNESIMAKRVDELLEEQQHYSDVREELTKRIENGEAMVESEVIHDDIDALDEQIKSAQATNDSARDYENWKSDSDAHEKAKADHAELDKRVRKLQASKKSALDNAAWPIDGLSIADGDVLYNGMLLENLGESEQILVCAALAIADIKSHEFKVVRIDGVESMGAKDFLALQNLFNGHGIQVLSTRVSRGEVSDGEIVITDGVYDGTANDS